MTGEEREREALSYLADGWTLVPIKPVSKEPYVGLLPRGADGRMSWTPLRTNPPDAAEVHRWFETDTRCNIAVVCGQPSGGLVVLDLDHQPADPSSLPHTPTVKTSRGLHLYLHSSEPVKTTTYPWGELRGEGAYVVAPPSHHPSGSDYTWLTPPNHTPLADLASASALLTATSTLPLPPPTEAQGAFRGEALRDWFRNPDNAMAMARAMGAPPETTVGQAFRCILPGHEEQRPSATVLSNRRGVHVYFDWHHRDRHLVYTLPAVRAAQAYGQPHALSKPEEATWALRLLIEARITQPAQASRVELTGEPVRA